MSCSGCSLTQDPKEKLKKTKKQSGARPARATVPRLKKNKNQTFDASPAATLKSQWKDKGFRCALLFIEFDDVRGAQRGSRGFSQSMTSIVLDETPPLR